MIASIPVGQLGKVEEIADLVGFPERRESGLTTGTVLSIDGREYMASG